MRVGYVVHRYGEAVTGGAETACRQWAQRLSARGHQVEVLTSCAASYVDWANQYPPGIDHDGMVVVNRLPVDAPRHEARFAALSKRALLGRQPPSLPLQQAWLEAQGPHLPTLVDEVVALTARVDVMVFVTYLYWTTAVGLPAAAGRVPILFHPTAHDEPTLRMWRLQYPFHLADAFGFLTPEEETLVRGRLLVRQPGSVLGLGVDREPATAAHIATVRSRFGLGDDPYLVCVGRVDANKGTPELVAWSRHHRAHAKGAPRLVLVGGVAHPIDDDEVVLTGVVDEPTKRALIAGSLALVAPSYFESLSIVMLEGWAQGVPVLAQGRSAVLAGQIARSGGGIAYRGLAEFEAAVELITEQRDLRVSLAAAGSEYLTQHYAWPVVMDRYERELQQLVT